ncbi:MAG: hypothetical protein QXK37_02180 [Candidatus Woesearchaeota archaeon]
MLALFRSNENIWFSVWNNSLQTHILFLNVHTRWMLTHFLNGTYEVDSKMQIKRCSLYFSVESERTQIKDTKKGYVFGRRKKIDYGLNNFRYYQRK